MNGARPDEVPIIMILVAAMFLLAPVGLALYLYVNGVFHTSYLRSFWFAFSILLFFFALTVGIGLIQHFYEGCCAPLQMWTGS